MQVDIARETLGAADEPEIELVLDAPQIADQLVLESFGVIDQIARVDLEKLREQHARRVGQVRAGAALDLREIALADGLAELLQDEARQLDLRDFAVEPTQGAFDFAQVPELFA